MDELIFNNIAYISSKRAAREYGYTKDYIGQLARAGKIEARLVGRNWYVDERSLAAHKGVGNSSSSRVAGGSAYSDKTNSNPISFGRVRSDITDDLQAKSSTGGLKSHYLISDVKYEADDSPVMPNLPTVKKYKETDHINHNYSMPEEKKEKKLRVVEQVDPDDRDSVVDELTHDVSHSAVRDAGISQKREMGISRTLRPQESRLKGNIGSSRRVLAVLAIIALAIASVSPFLSMSYSYSDINTANATEKVELLLGSASVIFEL